MLFRSGEDFTKYSKVYINGSKQKSQFLNNTRIDLPGMTLKDGDEIKIIQMGSSETPFRVSETYIYYDGKLQKHYTREMYKKKRIDWIRDSEMRMN